jgi:DNA-binding IclR family transcriptional regulator
MDFPATDPTAEAKAGGRGVLESSFALLDALRAADGAGVTRLAEECGLPKTTAHRLLEQLIGLGAVERSRGGYRLGARMFELGDGWQPHPALRGAVREPMRQLAAATGATVAVSVLRNGRDLIVDWIPGLGGSPVALRRGAAWPWYTAGGKALLAAAGNEHKAESAPSGWFREAEAIRSRGVAFDREDIVSGVCCAAVPLFGAPGTPVASLSVITDPAHRLDRLAEALRRVGGAVSAALRTGRAAA